MDMSGLSSNWKKLQATLKKDNPSTTTSSTKRKASDRDSGSGPVKKHKFTDKKQTKQAPSPYKLQRMGDASKSRDGGDSAPALRRKSSAGVSAQPAADARSTKVNEGRSKMAELGKFIAMDCEMVGVGPNPDHDSVLARVSIVNFNGDQIYDSYVRPKEMVTDWRTHVSGIAPKHMVEARSLEAVQKEVAEIMDGRILVGHAVSNDLDALLLGHPKRDIRDTSKHPEYRKIAGGGSPRLKVLAEHYLGLKIQEGAHSSVEDARATMALYRREKDSFEREHLKKWPVRTPVEGKEKGDKKKKKKKTTRKR